MAISDELGARRTVQIPAGTLELRERGSGPPVVLVHGAAVNGDLWRRMAPELAAGHRTVAVRAARRRDDANGRRSRERDDDDSREG